MDTEFNIKSSELESKLAECVRQGMNEFVLHDDQVSLDKNRLLKFLRTVEKDASDLFVTFTVDPSILDMDLCRQS